VEDVRFQTKNPRSNPHHLITRTKKTTGLAAEPYITDTRSRTPTALRYPKCDLSQLTEIFKSGAKVYYTLHTIYVKRGENLPAQRYYQR
jgi:hypothetical protein